MRKREIAKKENAYKDFMEDFEKHCKGFTDEEKKFLKVQLKWLREVGDVHGTYYERFKILVNAVMFFRFGKGYRPDDDIATRGDSYDKY